MKYGCPFYPKIRFGIYKIRPGDAAGQFGHKRRKHYETSTIVETGQRKGTEVKSDRATFAIGLKTLNYLFRCKIVYI